MSMGVQLFFTHPNGQGWSETYWTNLNNPFDLMGALIAANGESIVAINATNLLFMRRRLLWPSFHMNAIRIHVDGGQREGFYRRLTADAAVGAGTPNTIGADAADVPPQSILPADVAVLINFYAAGPPLLKKTLYLGGVDKVNTSKLDGSYAPTNAWVTALASFTSCLRLNTWQVRSRPLAKDAVFVSHFLPNPDAETAWLQPVPDGFPASGTGFVVVRGIKYPRGWNGTHKAIATNPPSSTGLVGMALSLGPTRRPMITQPAWNASARGTVQYMAPRYGPISQVIPQGIVDHQRGRPFGLPAGRRNPPD